MTSAIIVAAGKGTRMGPQVEKLLLKIHDCPVMVHTWHRFESADCIEEIIWVVRPGMQQTFTEMGDCFNFRKPFRVVDGGQERQDSVWNGLSALSANTEIVAIHDAARPCVASEVIEATITAARQYGAAVAAQPLNDTIKESADGQVILRTLDRSRLWAVQTPQTFRVEVIKRAVNEARHRGLLLTDDTAACELIGQPVHLVANHKPNPKLTRSEDLPLLEALLSPPPRPVRFS